MTVAKFETVVRIKDGLASNDRVWFPKWVRRFAMGFRNGNQTDLPVNRTSAIEFSRTLLSSGAPAWQRWQAIRALEFYRDHVLERAEPSLADVIQTLAQLGRKERNLPLDSPPTSEELAKIRGNINGNESVHLQTMRGEMRVLHYAMATERAYARWVKRFAHHVGSDELEQFNELDISTFLTELAVKGHVAASTQKQAQSALLFFYQCVLGKALGFIDAKRVKKSESIPVWFSKGEIEILLEQLTGVHRLMLLLMYGAGLRHKECRRLRIKDVCFDERHIVVRNGKGDKDRITFLPEQAIDGLRRQIQVAKTIHEQDVKEGFPEVYVPYALAKKYSAACQETGWKWVFPSRQRRQDKRSGKVWRHHISEEQFSRALKTAQRNAGIDKLGVPHSLRHSFATHLVVAGTDIQVVQKLLGHKDVETTMRYVHMRPKLGETIKSPVDRLLTTVGQ